MSTIEEIELEIIEAFEEERWPLLPPFLDRYLEHRAAIVDFVLDFVPLANAVARTPLPETVSPGVERAIARAMAQARLTPPRA